MNLSHGNYKTRDLLLLRQKEIATKLDNDATQYFEQLAS